MENINTTAEAFYLEEINMDTIILLNRDADSEDDFEDNDFDYDPNEMFYALNNQDQ